MKKLSLSFWKADKQEKIFIDLPPQMAHLTENNTVYAEVLTKTTLTELGASAGNAEVVEAACKWFCSQGKKVEAIKIVRQWTQCGLKEAKDWVEANCY